MPKREAPPLDPLLQRLIDAGIMSEQQARDVDAFADGVVSRVAEGDLTQAEADELVARTAIRDGLAELAARARRAQRTPSVRKRERRARRMKGKTQ